LYRINTPFYFDLSCSLEVKEVVVKRVVQCSGPSSWMYLLEHVSVRTDIQIL
jgi:hypothetical protein